MEQITIEILLSVLTFSITTGLGLIVLSKNPKSWTNRLFFVLAILIDLYIIINYISLHPPQPTPENQLFWVRLVMFITSFIGPVLLVFAHTFPREKITLQWRYIIPLSVLMFSSAIASLSPLVFTGIHYPGGSPIPIPGPGILLFVLDFVGIFILSFAVLLAKYRRAKGIEKKRIAHLLMGSLMSFSLMGATTVLFVVILQTSDFVFLGPILPVILMVFIGYAIIRYQLFNIKVLATEILIGLIWIVLFAKIFISPTTTERVIDALIFIATFVFGVLLIRSVLREVHQKEELQRITKELEEANTELKRLDKAKSEFVSIASHQLRTPLTANKGYLSLVLEGTYGKLNEKMKKPIRAVYDSNQRLVHLVNDLLSLSRIESGKINLDREKTDIAEIIQSVIDELQIKAEQKNLELVFQKPTTAIEKVSVDAEKIRNVVLNVIDNSIRYTNQGSVTTKLAKEGSKLHISISDTGEGMTQEELDNLFESFTRGEAGKKLSADGAGLGLYIAKQFVQMHKGKIWAESPGEGKGSTFHIELPVR